jgi:hypothetical protein
MLEVISWPTKAVDEMYHVFPIRFDFEAQFEVKIYKREGWNQVRTEQSTLTYYTDGSKKEGMTGMGIYGPSQGAMKP